MSERIVLQTTDKIEIIGSFQNNAHHHAALLLHMMPATKESWDPWVKPLNEKDFATFAIDERGHGQSTMNGKLNYKAFGDDEQQKKIHDVSAALAFLHAQGFVSSDVVVIGASIGANLAIQTLVLHPEITLAIALSPGLDFRGIKIDDLIQQLHAQQKVLLVASDDDEYSFKTNQTLHRLNPQQTVLMERKGIGHGTTMTENDPELMKELFSYL